MKWESRLPPSVGTLLGRHFFGAQQDLTPDPLSSVKGGGPLSAKVERIERRQPKFISSKQSVLTQEVGNNKSNGIFPYRHVCLLFHKFIVSNKQSNSQDSLQCKCGGWLVAIQKGELPSALHVTKVFKYSVCSSSTMKSEEHLLSSLSNYK